MGQKAKAVTFVKLLAVGYAVTVLLLLGVTFLLYRFQLRESLVNLLVTAFYVLGCLLGGFLSGKAFRQKRLFWGLGYGAAYFGILFLLSLFAGGLYQSWGNTVKVLLLCLAGGALGGMLS